MEGADDSHCWPAQCGSEGDYYAKQDKKKMRTSALGIVMKHLSFQLSTAVHFFPLEYPPHPILCFKIIPRYILKALHSSLYSFTFQFNLSNSTNLHYDLLMRNISIGQLTKRHYLPHHHAKGPNVTLRGTQALDLCCPWVQNANDIRIT